MNTKLQQAQVKLSAVGSLLLELAWLYGDVKRYLFALNNKRPKDAARELGNIRARMKELAERDG